MAPTARPNTRWVATPAEVGDEGVGAVGGGEAESRRHEVVGDQAHGGSCRHPGGDRAELGLAAGQRV